MTKKNAFNLKGLGAVSLSEGHMKFKLLLLSSHADIIKIHVYSFISP